MDYRQKEKSYIDWESEEVLQQILQKLVEDRRSLLTAIQSTEHNKEEQLAAELLATITEQDIEVT